MIIVQGSQSSLWTWLAPVLGFVGTLILFGASILTLVVTNRRADRRAIEDRRTGRQDDFLVWWRDKMLRSGEEVVRLGSDGFETYKAARYDTTIPAHDLEPLMDFSDTARQIRQHMEIFRLIGAADTAKHCEELATAINSAMLKNFASRGNLDDRDDSPAPYVEERILKNEFGHFHGKIYTATNKVRETVQGGLARTTALDWAIPNPPDHAPKARPRKAGGIATTASVG